MNFNFLFAIGGFGLNLNLFETNVLNLALVIFGLYKFLPNFLGGILARRRETILVELQDAESRLVEAKDSLANAKKNLASAEQKAADIRSECLKRAEAIRLDSEKRTVQEMARIKEGASSDLNAEAARVSSQLRTEAARLAIEKALAALPEKLTEKAQEDFMSQSIKKMSKA